MFGIFRKKQKKKLPPQLQDINGNLLVEGDLVIAQRYELEKCTIRLVGLEYFYKSEATDKEVSYVKMIDAITGFQKVEKIT